MWLVGFDKDYYPVIYKFEKEKDAREVYSSLKEYIEIGEYPDNESCVFIAEVKEYFKGKDYNIIDNKTDEELK